LTDADAAARHRRLLGIKLRALAADHVGHEVHDEPAGFPHGAALTVDGAAWVLTEGPPKLGGALAWAIRNGASSLDLVAEEGTGLLARRAERLRFPVSVWYPQERSLLAAVPEPLPPPPAPADAHVALSEVIAAAGATPHVEHGVVVGEVRGLEVCRVVDEPTVGHVAEVGDLDHAVVSPAPDDGVLLEVGVGPADREAFRLLHGDVPTVEALASVVETVAARRSGDAPQHPLNRLGQERYLRWRLEQDPGLVGMSAIRPAEPPLPRPNLKDPAPCVAVAEAADGSPYTIVCSVGVDLDLVGFVADVQATGDAPVIVTLRARDHVPITDDLLGLLAAPVEVRTVS
jgi:hypothetical protein